MPAAGGALLQALGHAIDAGGLPAPTAVLWHAGHVQVNLPAGGAQKWAHYFDRPPFAVTGRSTEARIHRIVVHAHLVGTLVEFLEDTQTSPAGAGG
jgi:hypothetical protein